MATEATAVLPQVVKIHCHGPAGNGCPERNPHPIATAVDGEYVVAYRDASGGPRQTGATWTTCPKCGTRRDFVQVRP